MMLKKKYNSLLLFKAVLFLGLYVLTVLSFLLFECGFVALHIPVYIV